MKQLTCQSFLVFLFATVAGSSLAETRYVSRSGSSTSPYNTWPTAATDIQVAVAASQPGDTVLVAPDHYTLSGADIIVSSNILIQSTAGAEATLVDGMNASRCFSLYYCAAVISGFTLTGGHSDDDGGGMNGFCA